MSVKVKQGLTKCLLKVEDNTFDEDTVRTLLILSREHLKPDSLIKEIAHFIAHVDRNQGAFHKRINTRYAKLKLAKEQSSKLSGKDWSNSIKTEEELSDFMLGGVSLDKIEAKLFTVLYVDGLDDLPESHLVQYTGFTKAAVKELFNEFYTRKEGFYHLTTNATESLIQAFKKLPVSKYNPLEETNLANQLAEAEQAARMVKSTIDAIQKVVRGAIYFNSLFDDATFKNEIRSAIIELVNKFSLDQRFIHYTELKSDDILLCIMTLLHDSKFIYFDKQEARIFFCFYQDYDFEKMQTPGFDRDSDLYENGVLALYVSGHQNISFPLFVSDLRVRNYISREKCLNYHPLASMAEVPWTTAKRTDEGLQLVDEGV